MSFLEKMQMSTAVYCLVKVRKGFGDTGDTSKAKVCGHLTMILIHLTPDLVPLLLLLKHPTLLARLSTKM